MDCTDASVLLIDDDAAVRNGLVRLIRSAGWNATPFASAEEFLASDATDDLGCIVLDIRMPGLTGPELHAWMREHDISLPVIYLSGFCDIRTSVQAMKLGASDVLEKPADADVLLQAIAAAVERHRQDCSRRQASDAFGTRLGTLSVREREVMNHVILGRLNKQIAADLGISEKTVKVHRGRMMAKMRVRSVAELVHQCDQFGIAEPEAA
ncbi:response regulator transcription factor [Lysobacter alkalisoli]|uniref:Response regulator transcription factor n=1 Tax=Marilutibacter alkalisoli TaxID=2591633 RepID=A0A514BST6_9GAMM|nr:response regulator transcription factor [Lysobacter alkalisoli]